MHILFEYNLFFFLPLHSFCSKTKVGMNHECSLAMIMYNCCMGVSLISLPLVVKQTTRAKEISVRITDNYFLTVMSVISPF